MPHADQTEKPFHTVRQSDVHGRGVFARRRIPYGTRIFEYVGERISWKEATRRAERSSAPPNHTVLFALSSGRVIDGSVGGNDARFINHGCNPNCEAREEGGRIFIYAIADIVRGDELQFDYGLAVDGRYTPSLKREFECRCQAPDCRRTMLAPKRSSKRVGTKKSARASARA